MQKYFNTVTGRGGSAVSGASVTVKTLAGATATIYSDNGVTVASNPLTTDLNGYFEFYSADGRYTLEITGNGISPRTITDVLLEDPTDSPSPTSAALAASGGAALVGFLQSGAGAVARAVQEKLRDAVCVFDFMTSAQIADVQSGAASIDVSPAIQAAWNYSASIGANLSFPSGTYRVISALSGGLVVLQGEGQGRTIIDFENFSGKDGFTFIAPTTYDRIGGIKGMTIRAKGQNGRYAIVTPRAADLNNYRPKYEFSDLAFTGTANTTGFAQNYAWDWMIDHGDCWLSHISNIDALGTYIIANDPAGQAEQGFLRLHGLQGLMSVRVDNVTTHNCKYGVEIKDRVFWYFDNVDIAESYKGIYSNRDDLTTVYGEGSIQSSVINAQYRGVDLEDRIATMCDHLTINRSNSGYAHGLGWIGLRLEDANKCNFNNLKIYAGASTFADTQTAISVEGGYSLNFNNLVLQGIDRGITLKTSAETTDIPNGVCISNVISETNVASSTLFDLQSARNTVIGAYSWNSGIVPSSPITYGDASTRTTTQVSNFVGTAPALRIVETDAASNEKTWFMVSDGGDFRIQARSDDDATVTNAVLINRTGTTIDSTELRGTIVYINGGTSQIKLGTSATPTNNSDMVFQRTSDTQLTIKVKGSDGTVRSANLTLA